MIFSYERGVPSSQMCGFNQSELNFLIWIVVWCPIRFQFPFMDFFYKSLVQSDTKSILGTITYFRFQSQKSSFLFKMSYPNGQKLT